MSDPNGHIVTTTNGSNPNDNSNNNNNNVVDDSNVNDRIITTTTTMTTTTEPNNTSTTVISMNATTPPSNNITNHGNRIASASSLLGTSQVIHELHLLPAFTLPDGRIIDGKNTLQSFDGVTPVDVANTSGGGGDIHPNNNTTTTAAIQPPPPAAYTLPDGRIIDGKNTLQSFAVIPPLALRQADIKQPQPDRGVATRLDGNEMDHGIMITTAIETLNIHSINRTNNNNLGTGVTNHLEDDMAAIHVEATPVRSVIVVDAEIAHSQVESNHPKRSWSFWLVIVLVIVLVGVVAGVGGYCGTGNCGGGSSSSSNSSNPSPSTVLNDNGPVSSPIIISNNIPVSIITPTVVTTISPVPPTISPDPTKPINEQWIVACNFLSLTNFTECQTITNYYSAVTGNTIPTEIGLLTQLTYLSLYDNPLNGTIPSTLGYLTQLSFLSLSNNQLNGTIPSTLGNLIELTRLDLYNNQLTGTIPSTLGNLIQLTSLYMFDNQLSGIIPSTLGNLTELNNLRLYNNTQLSGTIPFTLCTISDIYIGIDCANSSIVCPCCGCP